MGDPAENVRDGVRVDGARVVGALSPSRATDFKSCPLRYRYRTIDRLPEPPSAAAVRGTLVHKVLENLFDLPAADRTPESALALLPSSWDAVLREHPEAGTVLDSSGGGAAEPAWFASCAEILHRYFDLEDPRRLEPADRELYVEVVLDSGLLLRGVVDRLDVASDGSIRVVDYKTGRSPTVGFEAAALFQMRFYALVLWRTRGVVPALLRLIYLGDGAILSYAPDENDLAATERQVLALWDAIAYARQSGDWQPNIGPACTWCSFRAHCPAYGGTILPLPEPSPEQGVQGAGLEPGQGLDKDPTVALEDPDVVRHHENGAAGGLG